MSIYIERHVDAKQKKRINEICAKSDLLYMKYDCSSRFVVIVSCTSVNESTSNRNKGKFERVSQNGNATNSRWRIDIIMKFE